MPPTILPRRCVRCGSLFEAIGKRGPKPLYCGAKCKSGYESRRKTLTCLVCREPFVANAHARFCSRACQFKAPIEKKCLKCRETFVGFRGTKYCSEKCRDSSFAGTCECCEKPFTRSNEQGNSRFCSLKCLRRIKDPKKRAAREKVRVVEDVSPHVLYKRDKGICGLCREPVDRSLKWPDPRSASIDHKLPVSKDGEHSYANTQLAHLSCNLSKNNRCDPAPGPSPRN